MADRKPNIYVRSAHHWPDADTPARPRRTNAELMLDCARLGYLGGPSDDVIDFSYGLGNFWTLVRPPNLTGLDIDPAKCPGGRLYSVDSFEGEFGRRVTYSRELGWRFSYDVMAADQGVLTLKRGVAAASVWDAPYKLSGTPRLGRQDEAYGVQSFAPTRDRYSVCQAGCRVARRSTKVGGHVIVKVQDQVNGGARRRMTQMVQEWMTFGDDGGEYDHIDDLEVFGYRKQPEGREQQISHIDFSIALIFQRKR